MPSNKGLKLTRPEHIGASQLNPSVLRTVEGRARQVRLGMVASACLQRAT